MQSQTAIPDSLKSGQRNEMINYLSNKIYKELQSYCELENDHSNYIKLSGSEFFEKRLKEVFSTVVTTNSNVVENGSAFAYVKDKDANTLSINGAAFINDGRYVIDVGVATKLESDAYKFYAENSWANDITGSVGISLRTHFTNKADDYKDYISQCDSIQQIRWQFVNDTLLPKYNKLYKWVYDPRLLENPNLQKLGIDENEYIKIQNQDIVKAYVAVNKRIEIINNTLRDKYKFPRNTTGYTPPLQTKTTVTEKNIPIDKISTGKITIDGVKTTDITIDTNKGEIITLIENKELDLKKELSDLIEIRDIIIELLKLRDNKDGNPEPVESYIFKKFGRFDSKHDISTGYSISWLTLKSYLTNSTITINNQDIIDGTLQKKIQNLFKFSAELSWNFNYSKKQFCYLKLYSKFNRGSLLDSQIIKDNGFNVFADTSTIPTSYTIQDDNNVRIANYNELKHPVYNMDTGLYAAWLFCHKKSIGLSGQASFNFPIKGVQVEYKPTYTLLAGILLKSKEDAVIVNLSSGFEKQYHQENAWDNFIVKASVGVPFTIFEKKAKK